MKRVTKRGLSFCLGAACMVVAMFMLAFNGTESWWWSGESVAAGKSGIINGERESQSLPPVIEARKINTDFYEQHASSQSLQTDGIADPGPLPKSLAGANHEVTLQRDEQGNLIITNDIRHLFDFYLSAVGEETIHRILSRIGYELEQQLDGEALAQARALLYDYVELNISLVELEQQLPALSLGAGQYNLEAAKYRNEQLFSLRRQYLSSEAASAFYADEEAYDSFTLERLRLHQTNDLSEMERSQAIADLEQQLPPHLRQVRQRVTQHARLREQTRLLQQNGGSAEQVYQLRADALGEQAAQNLAQLDERRELWQQRLEQFIQAKQGIERSGLSDLDQTVAINELLEEQFQGSERVRARALMERY